jgi:Flp pilus assembly protein CpaB
MKTSLILVCALFLLTGCSLFGHHEASKQTEAVPQESDALAVKEGYSAVSVHVDGIIGSGRTLKPGDFVDVIMIEELPVSTRGGDNPPKGLIILLTVFRKVHVLAAESADVESEESPRYMLTLEMPADKAAILVAQKDASEIRTMLRAPTDDPGDDIINRKMGRNEIADALQGTKPAPPSPPSPAP